MALPLIYDARYLSWDSWASLMIEAYAGQQLSWPGSEDNWRTWAEGLKAIDIFTNDGIPGPSAFENWQDWVSAMINAVNQPTE